VQTDGRKGASTKEELRFQRTDRVQRCHGQDMRGATLLRGVRSFAPGAMRLCQACCSFPL